MPAHNRAGFTLVELLVALVVSSIVAGVVFQALIGQTRFARSQTAREEVQQNARIALEIIASELRGVATGGVTAAGPQFLRFRLPRAWGAICNVQSGSLAVLFPAGVGATFRSPGFDSLAVVPIPGTASYLHNVPDVTSTAAADAVTRCNGALLPDPPAQQTANVNEARARIFTATPAVANTGTMVYVYDAVRYDIGESSNTLGVQGYWIRRNSQPLAGPVNAATGLQFVYRLRDNSQTSNPPETALRDIVAIDVTVRTQSQGKLSNQPQRDTAATTIYLRNHY